MSSYNVCFYGELHKITMTIIWQYRTCLTLFVLCWGFTAQSMCQECVRRFLTWKEAMEKKGLRVNAGKIKIMICGTGLDLLQSSGKFPCAVCHTGVSSNSIFCNGCKHWVHKKCSGLKHFKKKTLTTDLHCARELHAPWMADHRRKSRSDLTSLRW